MDIYLYFHVFHIVLLSDRTVFVVLSWLGLFFTTVVLVQYMADLLEDVKSSFDSLNTKECIFFD